MSKKYLVEMTVIDSYYTLSDYIVIAETEEDMKWEVEKYYRENWDERFANCRVYELGAEVDISSFVENAVNQKKKEEEEAIAKAKALCEERERKEFERLKKKFEG